MTQQLNEFAVRITITKYCYLHSHISIVYQSYAENSIVYHDAARLMREGDLKDDFLDGANVGKLFSSLIKKSTN